MWYNELEGQADIVEKLAVQFTEHGMKKTKLEVSYYSKNSKNWDT